MAIDLEQLREEVVSNATDDYLGLYEIIWSLNTKDPAGTAAEKIAAGRSIIQDLLETNAIELYEANWPSNHFQKIENELAFTRIDMDDVWMPPGDGPYLSCLSTKHNALSSEGLL